MNQEEYDMMGEIAMLTRDASHPSGVRMCMVITRALLIGQRRRGLLIKTQAPCLLSVGVAIPFTTGSGPTPMSAREFHPVIIIHSDINIRAN